MQQCDKDLVDHKVVGLWHEVLWQGVQQIGVETFNVWVVVVVVAIGVPSTKHEDQEHVAQLQTGDKIFNVLVLKLEIL